MGFCGIMCAGWFALHVISEKMKIYSYLHIVKIAYPHGDS
jgi:hypothetical protein